MRPYQNRAAVLLRLLRHGFLGLHGGRSARHVLAATALVEPFVGGGQVDIELFLVAVHESRSAGWEGGRDGLTGCWFYF
jgi:hypothetical protein